MTAPTRENAWALLTEFTASQALRRHALAVEAAMRALARSAGVTDEAEIERWGLVGLLHDFDYEKYPTEADHVFRGMEILRQRGWPEDVIRAIGVRQAKRYFQSAERIDATRAFALGLAHEVVEEEALDAKIDEVVQALLSGGPKAQAAAKELIDAVADRPLTPEVLEDTAQRIARLRATEEAREGLSAFLEKRPAAWVPRP